MDDEESEGGDASYKKTKKAALALLEGNAVDSDLADKGLFALPFIKRSIERKKQAAVAEAERILQGVDSNSTPEESCQTGRLQFTGTAENHKKR